jgi:hypothetical protein
MTDTTTHVAQSAEEITREAANALTVLDRHIAQMREQKRGLGEAIAQALESRKPLARIVAAAEPRTPRSRKAASNGE